MPIWTNNLTKKFGMDVLRSVRFRNNNLVSEILSLAMDFKETNLVLKRHTVSSKFQTRSMDDEGEVFPARFYRKNERLIVVDGM